MDNQFFSLDILFNPLFLAISIIAFVVVLVIFLINKKRLTKNYKVLFSFILGLLMLYFIFIVWAIVGFGSNYGPKP